MYNDMVQAETNVCSGKLRIQLGANIDIGRVCILQYCTTLIEDMPDKLNSYLMNINTFLSKLVFILKNNQIKNRGKHFRK